MDLFNYDIIKDDCIPPIVIIDDKEDYDGINSSLYSRRSNLTSNNS